MKKSELDLLEKVFAAEIQSALGRHSVDVYQTKSALAKRMAEDGYVKEVTRTSGRRPMVSVTGYALTELGRITYCMSDRCKDAEDV